MSKNFIRFASITMSILFCFAMLLPLTACQNTPPPELIDVVYSAKEGGYIAGDAEQSIKKGMDGESVTAMPAEGYDFVGWSDGFVGAVRQDKNIMEEIRVTAEFTKRRLDLCYSAVPGGLIIGKENQTVEYGGNAEAITAIAENSGYTFVNWSDGNTNSTRHDINVTLSANYIAYFRITTSNLNYSAGFGGSISGKTSQEVLHGSLGGEPVTAVPDTGYRFVKWSDGFAEATRTDDDSRKSIDVTAEFEEIVKTIVYNYNYATGDNTKISEEVEYFSLEKASFVVPSRVGYVFDGWYYDWLHQTRVSDRLGNRVIGHEIFEDKPFVIFDNESNTIYAKWIAEEEIEYKLLLVFVTEVKANLITIYGDPIHVNYKMRDVERQVCEKLAVKMQEYLNAMLNGLVTFRVDTYFTTVPITEANFSHSWNVGSSYPRDNMVFAYNLPELVDSGIMKNYRSIITTHSMDDYSYTRQEGSHTLLRSSSGSAIAIYAHIPLESVFDSFIMNHYPIEQIFELMESYPSSWHYVVGYIHEFIHTIEMQLAVWEYNFIDYHGVSAYYTNTIRPKDDFVSVEIQRLFLLREIMVDGSFFGGDISDIYDVAGVPYEYWTGEIGY